MDRKGEGEEMAGRYRGEGWKEGSVRGGGK